MRPSRQVPLALTSSTGLAAATALDCTTEFHVGSFIIVCFDNACVVLLSILAHVLHHNHCQRCFGGLFQVTKGKKGQSITRETTFHRDFLTGTLSSQFIPDVSLGNCLVAHCRDSSLRLSYLAGHNAGPNFCTPPTPETSF